MNPLELERKIKGKMAAIKREELTPTESNIGVLFKNLKQKDEVLYTELINEYKIVLKNIK